MLIKLGGIVGRIQSALWDLLSKELRCKETEYPQKRIMEFWPIFWKILADTRIMIRNTKQNKGNQFPKEEGFLVSRKEVWGT